MPVNLKKRFSDKSKDRDVEWQDYEYDFTNDDGEEFHVTVHRKIIRKSPKKVEQET